MVQHLKLIVGFLLALSVVPYALSRIGIKCFSCNSREDPKCADPFDNSTIQITTCNQDKGPACRKIRQKVNGDWHYIRDCTYLGEVEVDTQADERYCQMKTDTENILSEHCTCNTKDGCNSSYSYLSKPKLLVTLLMVPYVFIKTMI